MIAAWNGNLEVVEFLIENGANVDVQNEHGWTALMCTARREKLLINNPKCQQKLRNIMKQLRVAAANLTTLMYAAAFDHLEAVKLLLATKTVNINQQNKFGWSALMYAAEKEKNLIDNPKCQQELRNIMNLLLAAKANPLLKAKSGITVLEQGNGETVKKCMRKQISGILVEEVPRLPKDLADLIAGLTC